MGAYPYFVITATQTVTNSDYRVSADGSYSATGSVAVVTVISTEDRTCWVRLNDDPTDYDTVQAAVDASTHVTDVVKVAGYCSGVNVRPRDDITTTGVVTQVVYISKTLTLRGGYTTTNWIVSDPVANPTTLDAQGQGRVLYITGDISPTIEGLRITGGDAAKLGGHPWGDAGGGVYIINATATISNNQMFSNTAYAGGGLSLYRSDATLSGNTVTANTVWGSGGGLYLVASDATLIGNTITANTANVGSGVYLREASDVTLVNNLVADNRANGLGSALYIEGSLPHLLHTTIARNVGGDGSGVHVTDDWRGTSSTVALTNTILVSHTVGITVTAGNTATLEATLWGTDTWANTTDLGGAGTIITGTRNYWDDPAFVDPGAGNYHIGPGSAAINQGVDAGVTVDIDGEPRPVGTGYDIGADEFCALEPIAGLAAINDSPTVLGQATTLTATVTSGSNVTYTWAFGDGTIGSGAVVVHTYPAVGIYTAVVTASNPVSVLTATTTVTVNNTPVGADVVVKPVDATTGMTPVTLTFSTVTQTGNTSLTTSSSGPTPPQGFKLGDPPTYYELTTTASFSPPVTVCISYSGTTFTGSESDLKLFHFEDTNSDGVADTWIDVTSSLDTVNDRICASVTSLSPFAILEPIVVLPATVDIDPDTLNLKSGGKWVTAYIELPEGYDVSDIDVGTVMLEDTIAAELHPTEVGDHDDDGVPDLMVKFDRQALIDYLDGTTGDVTLTVTGKLSDGTAFEGTDTIRVIKPGKK